MKSFIRLLCLAAIIFAIYGGVSSGIWSFPAGIIALSGFVLLLTLQGRSSRGSGVSEGSGAYIANDSGSPGSCDSGGGGDGGC